VNCGAKVANLVSWLRWYTKVPNINAMFVVYDFSLEKRKSLVFTKH
jgi:hypothetical protein